MYLSISMQFSKFSYTWFPKFCCRNSSDTSRGSFSSAVQVPGSERDAAVQVRARGERGALFVEVVQGGDGVLPIYPSRSLLYPSPPTAAAAGPISHLLLLINNLTIMGWGAAVAQWIGVCLPSCCPNFESHAHHLCFHQFKFVYKL